MRDDKYNYMHIDWCFLNIDLLHVESFTLLFFLSGYELQPKQKGSAMLFLNLLNIWIGNLNLLSWLKLIVSLFLLFKAIYQFININYDNISKYNDVLAYSAFWMESSVDDG